MLLVFEGLSYPFNRYMTQKVWQGGGSAASLVTAEIVPAEFNFVPLSSTGNPTEPNIGDFNSCVGSWTLS